MAGPWIGWPSGWLRDIGAPGQAQGADGQIAHSLNLEMIL